MTYSPGTPGSPGYQPAQGSGSYGAPASYGQPAADPGPSKLPLYLSVAVVVLGLIGYLVTFGPMYTLSEELSAFGGGAAIRGTGDSLLAVVAAALLAAVGLLPKAKNYHGIVAVLATGGVLLAISDLVSKPDSFAIGWAFWVFLAVVLLQAVAAIAALLLDAGVITAPAPRPKFEQPQQYGSYGAPGGYYGQGGQPQQPQAPGYPSQYGDYNPSAPAQGGYGAAPAPQSPPTPPTGYPNFGQPPAVGSGSNPPSGANAPTQQAPTQPPAGGPSPS